MTTVYTIGVYGHSEEGFFNKLVGAQIDTFCDIRMRRGVRGSKYAFVNSKRLQEKLRSLNIRYFHFKELAPTDAVRNKQKEEDRIKNVHKRSRTKLSQSFIDAFENEILYAFNVENFVHNIGDEAKNIVLFCVEEKPEACHRSVVASYLKNSLVNVNVIHL
jgi:uncharacterized protein (DUF488 family)